MVDLSHIEGFEWDAGNDRKSLEKHDVLQNEAEQVFVNRPLLLLDDVEHSRIEVRYHAYGKTHDGRLLQVSFTLRQGGVIIRVISARPMSARERARYAEEK